MTRLTKLQKLMGSSRYPFSNKINYKDIFKKRKTEIIFLLKKKLYKLLIFQKLTERKNHEKSKNLIMKPINRTLDNKASKTRPYAHKIFQTRFFIPFSKDKVLQKTSN